MDGLFRGQVQSTHPLRGGAVFRWESTTAGVLILAALGYNSPPPMVTDHVQNLGQLHALTGLQSLVGYRGCDKELHYFNLPSHKACSLPRANWTVTYLPVNLGLCVPLCFEHGRLTVPPRHWSMEIDLATLQWAID